MGTKLANITTQYRKFTKNQVLTEKQLNEVLDYFDDQVRLSRICLSGAGIVCGFRVSCSPEGTLTVTQGAGVTTDGDLFHLFKLDEESGDKIIDFDQITYTHYKVYENDKSPYKPFFYDEDVQIDLYEMHTEETDEDTHELTQLQGNEGLVLKDAVALIYLESYEKEKDLCVTLSCDNQGLEIVGNYKILLTSRANAEHIKGLDTTLSSTNFENLFYQLPDILANRAICLKEDFDNYPKLKRKFSQETRKNSLINRVKQGYNKLLVGMGLNAIWLIVEQKINELFSYTDNDVPPDFQYRYDLLKDLIDTYNEIKGYLAIAEANHCCADLNAFPKHLMLGEVERTDACYEFRHGFYKSPILSGPSLDCGNCDPREAPSDGGDTVPEIVIDFGQANLEVCYSEGTSVERIKSLIQRIALQLTNYNANYNFVKTTPSMNLGPLSKKAIPFYNNVGNQLIASWDFDKTTKGKQHKNNSYHTAFLDIKKPLKFCIDHDFYRIEGHQGRNYQEVLDILYETRRLNQLGFNVVALPINATESQPVIENYTSYYLRNNLGLDHKAGVVPGGTFVIIYLKGEYEGYPYPYGYGYPYGYPYDGGAPFGSDFEFPVETESQTVLNPVVADFMLPYLCCDQDKVSLRLPVDYLCFSIETEPLPFDVTPTGGYVEADVEEGLNGGVIRNAAGSFVFDPNMVSEELYGEPITFRVNNVDADIEITVEPRVTFELTVIKVDYDWTVNKARATFRVTGQNIPNQQEFSWNFGDGTPVVTSESLQIAHVYDMKIWHGKTVQVTTTTQSGECGSEETLQLQFDEQPQQASCEEQASEFMKAALLDFDSIEANSDFPGLPAATRRIFTEIKERLTVINNRLPDFLNGGNNNNIPEIYPSGIFEVYLERFGKERRILGKTVLEKSFSYYVQTLYRILGCQDNGGLQDFKNDISIGLKNVSEFLRAVQADGIDVDPNRELVAALIELGPNFTDTQYITNHLELQISILS